MMKLVCMLLLYLVISCSCFLLFMVYLYSSVRVLDMYVDIRVPGGYDPEHVALQTGEDLAAHDVIGRSLNTSPTMELHVERHEDQQYILMNGYQLNTAYLPRWFWDRTIAHIAADFGTRLRNTSPKIPFFVKPGLQYSFSSWARFWRSMRQESLYDPTDVQGLVAVLRDLQTLPIVAIEETTKSEHLSFKVQLNNGGWALMKPKTLLEGTSDGHSANIAAFQMDWALGYHRVPPTVGRYVDIKADIEPLMSEEFRKTIYTKPDGRTCFYGTCAGCTRESSSCCGDPLGMLEVSLTLLLPNNTENVVYNKVAREVAELIPAANPWSKITKSGEPRFEWVSDEFVCTRTNIQYEIGRTLYLDMLDALYFDMLTDNYERYYFVILGHFAVPMHPLLFGQGSAFIHTHEDRAVDEYLYERGGCCLMKKSTFIRYLKLLLGPTTLGDLVRQATGHKGSVVGPAITEDLEMALNRRLNKTLAFIVECLKIHKFEEVIIDDIY